MQWCGGSEASGFVRSVQSRQHYGARVSFSTKDLRSGRTWNLDRRLVELGARVLDGYEVRRFSGQLLVPRKVSTRHGSCWALEEWMRWYFLVWDLFSGLPRRCGLSREKSRFGLIDPHSVLKMLPFYVAKQGSEPSNTIVLLLNFIQLDKQLEQCSGARNYHDMERGKISRKETKGYTVSCPNTDALRKPLLGVCARSRAGATGSKSGSTCHGRSD